MIMTPNIFPLSQSLSVTDVLRPCILYSVFRSYAEQLCVIKHNHRVSSVRKQGGIFGLTCVIVYPRSGEYSDCPSFQILMI